MTFINIACIVAAYFAGNINAIGTDQTLGQVIFSLIILVVVILIGLANNGVIV